jgi:hypothetical protein
LAIFSRLMFSLVSFAARKGLAGAPQEESRKQQARETGIRGETYAYWYLRRHGYVLVAQGHKYACTKERFRARVMSRKKHPPRGLTAGA